MKCHSTQHSVNGTKLADTLQYRNRRRGLSVCSTDMRLGARGGDCLPVEQNDHSRGANSPGMIGTWAYPSSDTHAALDVVGDSVPRRLSQGRALIVNI